MKKNIIVILALFLAITLCACSGKNSLKGRYTSESEEYSVEFQKNGDCTWYQDDSFFKGTYKKTDDVWILEVVGGGLHVNTVFTATKDGDDLLINGGTVMNERFIKE